MRKKSNAEFRKPEILEHYYHTIIEEGFEGASIGKIAKRMGIHPSLIIHYFKTKENMTVELGEVIAQKYQAVEQWGNITAQRDIKKMFFRFMDLLFSIEMSATIDDSVYFTFYYLSFRNQEIRNNFSGMFKHFRSFLIENLKKFNEAGIINITDYKKAADILIVLVEGIDFHDKFVSDDEPFQKFAKYARNMAFKLLDVDKKLLTKDKIFKI
ncbi:MAG: TetR family transcriptional regulator [Desulfobacterales bacterium]|nr:TetR family transcriptional regulator [Desulfobacterales bacterium]